MNPSILITGATGFIGGHVVRSLVSQGYQVRAFGRNADRLAELSSDRCIVQVGDLRDRAAVFDACRSIDVVCHAGAFSSPWGKTRDFQAINIAGTRNVLDACHRCHVRRLVHISSPSVNSGRFDIVNENEDAPAPAKAISVYSQTKRAAEELVRGSSGSSLETVILRPKAVFGPGDQALFPRLARAAATGRLRQIGDGSNRVDLTYVDNVVHAIQLAMASNDAIGQTLLITNDEHPLLWDVIRNVCRQLGYNDRFRAIPFRVALLAAGAMELRARALGGEPLLTRYSVTIMAKTQTYDISRAKQLLGYRPIVSLDEGIAATLESLRAETERLKQ